MSFYEGAMARVRVDSELSEELEIEVGMHHRLYCYLLFCSGGRCCHLVFQR